MTIEATPKATVFAFSMSFGAVLLAVIFLALR
jgi:hypothetical protein